MVGDESLIWVDGELIHTIFLRARNGFTWLVKIKNIQRRPKYRPIKL